MPCRSLSYAAVCVVLMFATTHAVADGPTYQHPDEDWLTWEVYDAAGDEIDLDDYENGHVYVVVFSADDESSCNLMGDLADHIRSHPNKGDNVLAMCVDDTGHKALKRHIRQDEWTKRVADWKSAQEAARQAAEQSGEEFVPDPMPDFLDEIKDELADPEDLADLMDYHLPFSTGCRCEAMWDWLSERMDSPATAPRVLKFNSDGIETNEWTSLPAALGG